MTGLQSLQDLRRSSRISISIPLEVRGQDRQGKEVQVAGTTKYVNRHGGLLLTQLPFPADSEVTIHIPHLEREQSCRVIWVSEQKDKTGHYVLGIELPDAENFWGVQFPPEDWVPSPQVPLAGEESTATAVAASEMDDQERRTLRNMVNALVAVLEEKGLLTRAELAETFQRLNRSDAANRTQNEARTRSRDASS